jgi:beta-lactamase regulating signal transducer with metallopeptidase domain/thiol-disulfide isomerase/thioredoxin/protocatechuate 3,4-dioxygenase beta subunit
MPRLFSREVVEVLNDLGGAYGSFAVAMFVQLAVLIAVLAGIDFLWLKRTRATVRYAVWSLILVKLMLPVGLQGPLTFTGALNLIPQGATEISVPRPAVARSDDVAIGPPVSPPQHAEPKTAKPFPASVAKLEPTSRTVTDLNGASPAVSSVALKNLIALDWPAWLFLAWLVGQASLVGFVVRRFLAVRALVRAGSSAAVPLHVLLRDCQRRLRLEKQSIALLVSDQLSSPAICGFWRATILLPRLLAERLTDEQLRLVFVHELTHWKRLDLQVNYLQTLLAIVYFYNPLVWIANALLRRLRELAVDEAVLATMRSSAQQYSSLLLDIAAMSRRSPELSLRIVGVVESPKALPRRIRRILAHPNPHKAQLGLSGLALMVLVGVTLLPLAGQRATVAQQQPPATKAIDKPASDEKPAVPEPIDLAIDVANDELAGIVQDEDGNPIAGVTVDAWHWHPGNETTTDAKGQFRLKGFDDKRNVEVLISKDGYCPQHFAQRPPGAKNWVVVLGRKTYFEGTVVGVDGKPVAGAAIRASFGPVQGDGVVITEVTTEGKSREDGTYRLYVAPGNYDLQISGGTGGVFRQSGVVIKRDEAKSLPVQFKPGVRFEAQVRDSITNEPVEGFILWQWRGAKLFARSNAEGRIIFDGLIPGKIQFNCGGGEAITRDSGIRFYQNGPFGRWWSPDSSSQFSRFQIDESRSNWQRNFDDVDFNLRIGMQPVTIIVEQGVTVTGRVTDPRGAPVAGATVAPARTGSGNSLTGDTRYSVRTEKDGAYKVVLPASNKSTYNLIVHDGDYEEWRNWANGVSEPMQTKPGQKIESLDLQLTEGATIRGKVMIGDRPAVGRDVRTHAFDKLENRYYDPTTNTKNDGTFELKFVRPGKHYLQVEPFWLEAENAKQGSKIIEVKAGEILEGIELNAAPQEREVPPETAALPFKARVLDSQGRPVANIPVGLGVLGGAQNVRSDDQGRAPLQTDFMSSMRQSTSLVYAFDFVENRAGIGLLNLQDHVKADPKNPPVIDIRLEPASPVRVVVDASLLNQLGKSPKGIQLFVAKDSLPLHREMLLEPSAKVLILPPGDYQVTASEPYLVEQTTVNFKVATTKETLDVKIELQPSRMVKLIGQPAPDFAQIKTDGTTPAPRLTDFKGKVVVLDFWGYWCGPCIAAMPKLMGLYDEFHNKGVEFIAIHDDSLRSVEELRTQLNTLKIEHWNGRDLPFTALLDGGGPTPIPDSKLTGRGATTAAYGIQAFPTTLVIDQQGRLAGQLPLHEIDSGRRRLNELLQASP